LGKILRRVADVRFGSLADIRTQVRHVGFAPESRRAIVRIDDREVPKADITYARKDVPGLPHFP